MLQKIETSLTQAEQPIAQGTMYMIKDYSTKEVVIVSKVDGDYVHFFCYDYEEGSFETKDSQKSLRSFKESIIATIPEGTLQSYLNLGLDVINGKETLQDEDSNAIDTSTALVSRNAKQSLSVMHDRLEEKRAHVEIVKGVVEMEIAKRMSELDKVKSNLAKIMEGYTDNMREIQRVITSIELYMGVDEELHQIKFGAKADQKEPICFRQQVLFMDEEVGHWQNGGLDWTQVEWFDKWLLENDNYKDVIPESKGMVAFRPRRYEKDYGDKMVSAMNKSNDLVMSYILIRNGENLYRVYTEKIVIHPRLFPLRKEVAAMHEATANGKDHFTVDGGGYFGRGTKISDFVYQYRKQTLLMQGLMHRTDVFHPLPSEDINLFNPETLEGRVNYIYDDEMLLPTGRKTFREWMKEINSKIEHGSRVCIFGENIAKHIYGSRWYVYYKDKYSEPPHPSSGIYEVESYMPKQNRMRYDYPETEEHKKFLAEHPSAKLIDKYNTVGGYTAYKYSVDAQDYEELTIMYNPKDEVFRGWGDYEGGQRKNRIRYRIDQDDSFILNYDQISLDEVNFYLKSRTDRPNYLDMMPILQKIKEMRLKELEQEKHFVRLIVDRNSTPENRSVVEQKAWMLVEWWKTKNQWKRPIDKDDQKALRMIESKLKAK
jgi:hypothetical protein